MIDSKIDLRWPNLLSLVYPNFESKVLILQVNFWMERLQIPRSSNGWQAKNNTFLFKYCKYSTPQKLSAIIFIWDSSMKKAEALQKWTTKSSDFSLIFPCLRWEGICIFSFKWLQYSIPCNYVSNKFYKICCLQMPFFCPTVSVGSTLDFQAYLSLGGFDRGCGPGISIPKHY